MLLVLIVMTMAVILGASYLHSASISLAGTHGQTDLAGARYAAESGLQHGLCLLRVNRDLLVGSDVVPLGPFPVGSAGASYTISAIPVPEPGRFTIKCQGFSGRARQSCGALIQSTVTPFPIVVEHGLLIEGAAVSVPAGVSVFGPVHVNGDLTNHGTIAGATTATGLVTNLGSIAPAPISGADPVPLPPIVHTGYYSYLFMEQVGQALIVVRKDIPKGDPIVQGGSITPENPAGVVVVRPEAGRTEVAIKSAFVFSGTLIVEGDVVINGKDIFLTAPAGFPALIVTGNVLIKGDASATMAGMVYIAGGVLPVDFKNPQIAINGALVCGGPGISDTLTGTHTITHNPVVATLTDPQGRSEDEPVDILQWYE